MASSLTTIPQIAACLGMLGSDHDGEVLAAAKAAERLPRQLGLSWEGLLTNPPVDAPRRRETSSRDDVDPMGLPFHSGVKVATALIVNPTARSSIASQRATELDAPATARACGAAAATE